MLGKTTFFRGCQHPKVIRELTPSWDGFGYTFLIWFWGIIKIFLHLALIRHFEKNRILSELRL